jgi:hypothetical protein
MIADPIASPGNGPDGGREVADEVAGQRNWLPAGGDQLPGDAGDRVTGDREADPSRGAATCGSTAASVGMPIAWPARITSASPLLRG